MSLLKKQEKIKERISSRVPFPFFIIIILSNTLISLIISSPLLKYSSYTSSIQSFILGLIPFVSHYFMINLVIGIFIIGLSLIFKRKIFFVLSISLYFLLQTLLIIDTKIYTIFSYHINSLVWNVCTIEGVSDSVSLGKGTTVTFAIWLSIILLIEIIMNVYFNNFLKNKSDKRTLIFIRTSQALFVIGLFLIFLDKGMYAYADLVNNTNITKNAKLYPLYQSVTIKRFASSVLHMNVNREENLKISNTSAGLNYPKKVLRFDPAKDKKYNIIIIVLEGLRFDMLDKEIMPNVLKLGQKGMIFNNHYSGGNGSRFGVFSLLYGIHGAYWHNFLAHRISPVLIDTLIGKGYEFKVLSSTRLTFPEFRRTAFIRIPEAIEDTFTNEATPERDRIITEKFIRYISTKKSENPFFAFIFYDSSHQPYRYPKEFEKFSPVSSEEINYFKDAGKEKIFMLRNRYKNAFYYDDNLIGKVITALKENKLLDKSIVLITGDHGEELYENGYFGHTSSFDDYQTKTVFVLHHPEARHKTVSRLTSHIDLVPTLMESIGCVSQPGDYSQGLSLLSDHQHTYVDAANWDTAAIIDNEHKIIFSTELYNISSFEIRSKNDYQLVKNTREIIKQKKNLLLDVVFKMSEFYR